MSDEQEMDTAEMWRGGVRERRARLTEEAPELLGGVDVLVRLRGNLDRFIEPIESSLEGYDPNDPGPEGTFGDIFLEETIALMENLPTLLASLGLETGGMLKVVSHGMELQVRYDPYLQSVSIGTGERSRAWYLLDEPGGVVGLTADHRVVHVGVSSDMFPLRAPQYDPVTDVLSLRDPSSGVETPDHVTENGPLVGYLAHTRISMQALRRPANPSHPVMWKVG